MGPRAPPTTDTRPNLQATSDRTPDMPKLAVVGLRTPRRSAVLTVIEFERRQLAALPAEVPRHGAELGHDLVHVRVASADDADVLCALRHRHLTSQRAAVHRGFRA